MGRLPIIINLLIFTANDRTQRKFLFTNTMTIGISVYHFIASSYHKETRARLLKGLIAYPVDKATMTVHFTKCLKILRIYLNHLSF